MAQAVDVAVYVLEKCGRMTAMKLQKLVYYSQAWNLAWDGVPIFREGIQAWANGPVVHSLYAQHKGRFEIRPGEIKGNKRALTDDELETIDAVIDFYGKYSSHELSDLAHREAPWQNARAGLAPGQRGNNTISKEEMQEFYAALDKPQE